jgi:hypothetical protein
MESFAVTVLISLALYLLHTYRGGLKPSSLILTNIFLVTSVFMTIYFICQSLNLNTIEAFEAVKNSNYSKISSSRFLSSKFHFVKQIQWNFVTIAMVGPRSGLDAKNLLCKPLAKLPRTCLFSPNICTNQYLLFKRRCTSLYL